MKRLLAAAIIATAPIFCAAASAAATLPGAAWSPTATHALRPRNARLVAAAPRTLPLHIVVGLRMRDRAGAERLLRRETTRGDAMFASAINPDAFTRAFNPSPAQVGGVVSYLAANGMRHIAVEPNNLIVSADATAAQAATAFHTAFGVYAQRGRFVYANVQPAQVPPRLAGTVAAVLGLSNADEVTMHPHAQGPAPCQNPGPVCLLASYGPTDFQKYYDAYTTPNAWGLPIAVFAEGNVAQVLPDLRTYEKTYGLPQAAYSVRKVGIASPDVSGLDEWDLDTQTSTGMAQQIGHLYVYDTTSLSDADTALEFSKFTTDNVAKAGNASFGICETFAMTDGSEVVDDNSFLQAASQGQTVFSSTGDNGNGCPLVAATGAPGLSLPENSYPATSPYVVGVGGTTIVSPNGPGGSYSSEITWIGTGGGVSQTEASPFWQAGPVNKLYATAGRTLPDVVMDGDPNTGASIFVNGTQTAVGGTSLSSPLTMGVWARLDGSRHGKLPFASPLLYQAWEKYVPGCSPTLCLPPTPAPGATTQAIGGYHDILLGSNGGPYGTLPGYDLETGLGSFDVGLTQTAIKAIVGY